MPDNIKKNRKKSSLRKRMIFYFLLIAIANIFVAGEFVWELKSESYRTKILQEITSIRDGKLQTEHIYNILDALSQKFVIMILILIIVSAVVLFLFVVQIASPIQYMINKAERMSEGDLSIRINIKSQDEIAVLGKLINDLTINIQEIIAQMERMVFNLEKVIGMHNKKINQHPKLVPYFKDETELLEQILKEFQLLINAYILFTIESIKQNSDDENEIYLER